MNNPTRKTDKGTQVRRGGANLDLLLRHQCTPVQAAETHFPAHLCWVGLGLVGLELIVLAVCKWFGGWLWAGGRCHQLHEVLATAGLCGAGHHSLLPAQQAHLGRVGGQVGAQVGLARRGSPTRLPALSTHRGGAVWALPTASALFILHGAELVMFRAGPRAPGAIYRRKGC